MLPFKLVFHPGFTVDLGPHVFPVQKYRLVQERVLQEGLAEVDDFIAPHPATDEDLARVHTPEYVEKARTGRFSPSEVRMLEIPWSPALAAATWLAAGASIEAGRLALRDGCCIVIGGGFHHAFPDHGEGFCLINNVAVAAAKLLADAELSRVAVVDLDVHHGNGTATILGNDPRVFTLSIHQENNYPGDKPPSTLDVGLPDGAGDAEYLAALDAALPRALDFAPDLVWYLAGADPYEQDVLGGLGLTQAGLRERDRRVFESARRAGVPVAVTLAGGYAQRAADTVAIHVSTIRAAAEVFASRPALA